MSEVVLQNSGKDGPFSKCCWNTWHPYRRTGVGPPTHTRLSVIWYDVHKVIAKFMSWSFLCVFFEEFYSFKFYVQVFIYPELILVHAGGKGVILSFCMWISNVPSLIYWRDCPFFIVYSWQPCQRVVDCKQSTDNKAKIDNRELIQLRSFCPANEKKKKETQWSEKVTDGKE